MSRGYFADMHDLKKNGGKVILLDVNFVNIFLGFFIFVFFPPVNLIMMFVLVAVLKMQNGFWLIWCFGACGVNLGRLPWQVKVWSPLLQQWSFQHWKLVILMVKFLSFHLGQMVRWLIPTRWIFLRRLYFVYRFVQVRRFAFELLYYIAFCMPIVLLSVFYNLLEDVELEDCSHIIWRSYCWTCLWF